MDSYCKWDCCSYLQLLCNQLHHVLSNEFLQFWKPSGKISVSPVLRVARKRIDSESTYCNGMGLKSRLWTTLNSHPTEWSILIGYCNCKSEQKTNARLRWKFYQFTLTILFVVDFILLAVQYSKLERMPMLFRWMRPFMILVSREKIGHVMLVIIRVIIRMYRFWVRF